MSDWNRTTHECPVESLRPEMVAAINEHIGLYNLGAILVDARMCVETTSFKTKKGLLSGSHETVYSGDIVSPHWLVWAVSGERTITTVMSARLADITVSDYEKSQFYKMMPDNGIEVTGSFTDVAERGNSFIGLGRDAAGEKFKQMLLDATQNARK